MTKNLFATVGLGAMCLCLASATAYSEDSRNIWELPNDVLGTPNQISFNQGANGVWYFMESNSLAHDPLIYRFLPNFTAPCSYGTLGVQTGVQCWADASDPFHVSNFEDPKVSVNASSQFSSLPGETPYFPPNTLAAIPGPFQLVVVAWRSPVDGFVNVTGTFTVLQPGTNGVIWSVDKGSTTLKSALLLSGSASFSLRKVQVNKDDVLYFTVDPNGDSNADNTALQVTIKR
jgi:hypothetical protein